MRLCKTEFCNSKQKDLLTNQACGLDNNQRNPRIAAKELGDQCDANQGQKKLHTHCFYKTDKYGNRNDKCQFTNYNLITGFAAVQCSY